MDSSITAVEHTNSPAGLPDATVIPSPDPDPRKVAFGLVAAGVASGLPIPRDITIGEAEKINVGDLKIQFGDNDAESVRRWAAYLRLPEPAMTLRPMESRRGWFQPYEAYAGSYPGLGRRVTVESYLDVDAPVTTAAEVTA